jgi:hypothetical protein
MTPDPYHARREAQKRVGVPGTASKATETNWAAVSAVAAVAGVLVAFLAWSVPGRNAPPPAPVNPQQSQLYPTTTQQQGSAPANTSSGSASSGLAVVQPSGPPAGCPQAIAAINTYNQDVGSTSASEENAAQRAYNEIEQAQEAAGYGSSAVSADLFNLSNDFKRLYADAGAQNSSDYASTTATTNVDARQLEQDCNG